MGKILIGPAGTGGSSEEGFRRIKELGLDAVEVEFTYNIWMKKEDAVKLNKLNKELKLRFSIHAPYFVNLASFERPKVHASKSRILKSCEIGHYLGAKYIVFHAGFYQKKDPEIIYHTIKKEILDMMEVIKEKKWKVVLAPETTGKASQFGSLDELIRLKKETGCNLCVDFAHLRARNKGKIDYDEVMKKLKPLGHIHAHFSGIEWTDKGERRHLLTEVKDMKDLFNYLKKYKIDVTIINESPDPFGDAVKMKKLL
ncbi:endonuclease IV [Candidatus Woesearchaeota archaeon B3_Woes]|nr:MAG: endonuclease IV [Candidatus Woesearchaeota archaeon B3_Woes]